jgi:hypothetical protein
LKNAMLERGEGVDIIRNRETEKLR